ncbi:MAG: hypothetical protein WKF30_16270 [Pyrinomonadaceae bacterium]
MKKLAALCLLLAAFAPVFLLRAQSRARRVVGAHQSPPPAATTTVAPPRDASRPPVLSNQGRGTQEASQSSSASGGAQTSEEVGADEVVKVDTTLVTIPVSVMDRDGKYIPYLRKDDFRIFEDGVEHEIAYFGATEKPFTVALVIDTSRSTKNQRVPHPLAVGMNLSSRWGFQRGAAPLVKGGVNAPPAKARRAARVLRCRRVYFLSLKTCRPRPSRS